MPEKKMVCVPEAEHARMIDMIQSAESRHGMELAALERRYQERMEQMQRDHAAEVTRLESAIARQAQQFKEAVNTVIQLQQLLRSPQGQRREEAEGEASCQPA